MASSSGLYGEATLPTVTLAEPSSPTGQDVSSTNSTSLYGGAATPIPDSSGNLVVRGDLIVLSGNVLTTATEGNIFPANATTVNIGLAGTAVNIGAGTGTTTVNNNLAVAGDLTINGAFIAPDAQFGNITIAVADDQTITTTTGRLVLQSASGEIDTGTTNLLSTNSTSFNLLNSPTTVNAFNGATALALGAATGTTTIRNDATVSGDLRINGNDIKSSANTTAISLSGTNVTVANDFTVNGNNVNLAQATVIGYSESNSRLNRPTVKSTTGNTSGLRVEAPNATTSASSSFTAFSSNDADNGKFINITARGATSSDLRIQTGKYTAGVLGASGTVVSFVDNITTYATVNPAGPTDPSDLTTKSYVDGITPNVPTYDTNVAPVTGGIDLQLREIDIPSITIVGSTKFIGGTNVTISETSSNEVTISAPDTNTTYTIDASSTTGGANLNLAGSDASTDTVKFASGTGISVAQTDTNTITVNSTITQYTDAQARASISATGDISYNSTTGVISYTAPAAPVTSVNSKTGAVVLTTTDISEGTNLYYTDVRARGALSAGTGIGYNSTTGVISSTITQYTDAQARAAISATGSLTYNSTTGVIDYTTPTTIASLSNHTTTDLAEGTNLYYTDARARASISATGDISYNSTTGVISYTAPAAPVTSVNGKTGAVVLTTTDISEGTNLYYTDARVRSVVANGVDLAVNGSNQIYVKSLRDGTRLLGSLQATTDDSYTFPAPLLTTITNNNGLDAVSSMPTGTNGNAVQAQFTSYLGDTLAGANTGPVFTFRSANGNSTTSGTVPFTGLTPTAASAITSSNVLGGLNFNGYATTGFTDTIGSASQGGGYNAVHAGQIQMAPVETFADSTLTISGATITAVSRVNAAQTVTAVAGTKGQLTIPSTLAGVGTAVIVTGTNSGTATGISAGTYYIIANNGGVGNSTQITISATVGGNPINTTPGTVTGLTFTRQLITVTYSAQTNIPFGLNAKVTISGFTNVTSGTYMLLGASTTTTASIGAPSSGTPTLSGSQSVSCPTVTAGGTLFRVRGFAAATPLNSATRIEYINHAVATATYKSNQFNFQGGTNAFNYLSLNAALAEFRISGTIGFKDLTGVNLTGDKLTYNRVYGQWEYNSTITPVAANTAYVFPIGTADFNNIATVGSTSRIILGAPGKYNLQFSVQVSNGDNGADHIAYIWLKKNGVDLANSTGRITVVKANATIAGWNFMIDSANTTDYYEIGYAVDDVRVTFPAYSSTAFCPGTASLVTTVIPVGA